MASPQPIGPVCEECGTAAPVCMRDWIEIDGDPLATPTRLRTRPTGPIHTYCDLHARGPRIVCRPKLFRFSPLR